MADPGGGRRPYAMARKVRARAPIALPAAPAPPMPSVEELVREWQEDSREFQAESDPKVRAAVTAKLRLIAMALHRSRVA